MAQYRWYTAKNVGSYPPTGGAQPPWYTPGPIPKAIVRCASPAGAGDILVRTEVAGYWGFVGADYTIMPDVSQGVVSHLLGEVGSSSSLPPDPTHTGTGDFAFSAWMDMHWEVHTFGSPTNTYPLAARLTTGGYITSHAKRGPAQYGSGAPSFNLGIITEDDVVSNSIYNHAQSYWAFYVRCLWKTP